MQILEGSDTRVKFKITEIEDNISYDLDLTDYDDYLLEIRFSDDSLIQLNGTVGDTADVIFFDIFGEYTEGKAGSLTADIRGVKGVKKVRFNPTTIKGKVLDSVIVPDVLQNDTDTTTTD